ncbi:MAG: methyltransferase domain-containing protein [Actinomycetota bacterium]
MSRTARCNACEAPVDPERDLAWVKDGFDLLRCPRCGLVFRADLPSPEELPELYSGVYFRSEERSEGGQGYADYVAEGDLHRLNARRRLSLIEASVPPGRLLDVGCAAGFFLDEARQRGWTVTGVELSDEMATWASNELGIDDVIRGTFTGQEWPEAAFDCVTMWDYIEHTLDPFSELCLAHRTLRPDGLLALSTGDVGSVVARASSRRWHLLTPQHHNYFFTRRSLSLALERAGFTVLAVRYLAARYSVRYLVHKLRTLSDLRSLRRLERGLGASRLGSVAVPLNLWDIVTVVARSEKP